MALQVVELLPVPVPADSTYAALVETPERVDTHRQTIQYGGPAQLLVGVEKKNGNPVYVDISRSTTTLRTKNGFVVATVRAGRFSADHEPKAEDVRRWQHHFG